MKWSRNRKLFLAVSLVMIALLFLDFVMVFIIQNEVLTFIFSLLSVIAGVAFYSSLSSKNRKLFVVISMATLASLISLLVIVPYAFGDTFVSFSFQLLPFTGPGRPAIEIVYFNGSLIKVCGIGLEINETNNYFRPVQVHYNGFEYVMLVYNHTVTDPSDIVNNKPFLIWGAFYAVHTPRDVYDLSESWAYNYYAARRNSFNYTATLPIGTYTLWEFVEPTVTPKWGGQDLNGDLISPGIYYVHCVAYGKILGPISLNVTRAELYLDG